MYISGIYVPVTYTGFRLNNMTTDQLDNKPLELEAKSFIANRLFRAGFLVADPQFDIQGSDLLIFHKLESQVKILIVQSKGRSVSRTKTSNVRIKKEYVQEHFVVLVYIKHEQLPDGYFLYCYFRNDVEKWPIKNGEYTLYIPSKFHEKEEFKKYAYGQKSIDKIGELLLENTASIHYFKGLSLCQKLFLFWQSEGSIPSLDDLVKVFSLRNNSIASVDEAILILVSSYLRAEQHEENYDNNPHYTSFEYLLGEIVKRENRHSDLITENSFVKYETIESGGAIWYGPVNKYLFSKLTLKIGDIESEGLYALVRDSEGEGIEMFLPRNEMLPSLIRAIHNGAESYYGKIARFFSS
jgi:hypothetical protein